MSSENQSSRKLAAILFADVAGYTAIMQKDEKAAAVLLRRFQSELETRVPKSNGEIINFYGDGAFCIFQNPLEAMQCAIELQKEFQNDPKVPLRIGIHSGTVVIEGSQAYGDNVNIASRIESMGIPGAILVSKKVRDELKNQPDMLLPSLGKFEFKNIEEPMEVFALANKGFVVPQRSQMQGKLKSSSEQFNWKPIALIIAVLALAVFAFNQFGNKSTASNDAAVVKASIPNNSIAILPFDNMSADSENEYFSEGIHDDLITHISKIGDMKVISRTSVLQFKEKKPPLPEIAKTLGVAHVMEGSIRRSGNQIRINVQLINAETDDHIWSEIYDRELTPTNIFDIQTEIAKKIAAALNTNITADQNKALTTHPTENLEAYESYLKCRQLLERRTATSIKEAQELINKAIQLDPDFALAYVTLAEIHYLLPEYAFEDARSNYELAWESLAKAKSLNNNLSEAYALECGLYHYDNADIKGATQAFEKAVAINPNNANAYFWYGHAIFEIERDIPRAVKMLENALKLNPLSVKFLNMYGWFENANGNRGKSIATLKKAIEMAPDYRFAPNNISFLYAMTGQMDSALIIAHVALQKNQRSVDFIFDYVSFLEQLSMFDLMNIELDNFSPLNRQDSIVFYSAKARSAFVQQSFDKMFEVFGILKNLSRDIDPIIGFNISYFTKDFKNAVNIYESIYPDILRGKHFDRYLNITGYNIKSDLINDLQKYIYCLSQINEQPKVDQLIEIYGTTIIESNVWEEKFGVRRHSLFKAKDHIIKGENKLAIKRLEDLYSGQLWYDWQFTLMDPIFDVIRDNPEFQQINVAVKANAAQQRETVMNYLKGKD